MNDSIIDLVNDSKFEYSRNRAALLILSPLLDGSLSRTFESPTYSKLNRSYSLKYVILTCIEFKS